jgi:hypothetical protein
MYSEWGIGHSDLEANSESKSAQKALEDPFTDGWWEGGNPFGDEEKIFINEVWEL